MLPRTVPNTLMVQRNNIKLHTLNGKRSVLLYQSEQLRPRKQVSLAKLSNYVKMLSKERIIPIGKSCRDCLKGCVFLSILTCVVYRFVLTYIPDLKWCHLAPMIQDGYFGPERKRAEGRPKWKLVDESLGHELDISSMFCIPVKSKALRHTVDADKEEWDILDGPVSRNGTDVKSSDVLVESGQVKRKISKQPAKRPRSATKPMEGKIAIRSPVRSPLPDGNSKEAIFSAVLPARSTPDRTPSKKRKLVNENMDPARKARKMNNVGTMRSVLQS